MKNVVIISLLTITLSACEVPVAKTAATQSDCLPAEYFCDTRSITVFGRNAFYCAKVSDGFNHQAQLDLVAELASQFSNSTTDVAFNPNNPAYDQRLPNYSAQNNLTFLIDDSAQVYLEGAGPYHVDKAIWVLMPSGMSAPSVCQ